MSTFHRIPDAFIENRSESRSYELLSLYDLHVCKTLIVIYFINIITANANFCYPFETPKTILFFRRFLSVLRYFSQIKEMYAREYQDRVKKAAKKIIKIDS